MSAPRGLGYATAIRKLRLGESVWLPCSVASGSRACNHFFLRGERRRGSLRVRADGVGCRVRCVG